MAIEFQHNQSAHCENGASSNLLNFYGLNLSEPMVFGIGSGLFFSYMPFVKLNSLPVVSFRPWPGAIFKRTMNRLDFEIKHQKFSSEEKAMLELDNMLEKDIPVGMLVGVYNLPYFPPEYRFHFNAHNIVAVGKEDGKYLISDPVMENIEELNYDELKKVRFAKGTYPPKGRMYYVVNKPEDFNLEFAIIKGIKKNCKAMLEIPIPLFGVKGITYLAGRVKNWPEKLGEKKASLYLGQTIRMLEEIGTGGAGFRFMYAAFLQQSADIINRDELKDLSLEMTAVGDKWREFSYLGAKNLRSKNGIKTSYSLLSEILIDIAGKEEKFFKELNALINE